LLFSKLLESMIFDDSKVLSLVYLIISQEIKLF